MRVLLLEYLHAQSDAYAQASDSMRSEGRAMLTAVIEDLQGHEDIELTVAACQAAARDCDLRHCLSIPDGPVFEFPEHLIAAIGRSSWDRVLIIAPETAGHPASCCTAAATRTTACCGTQPAGDFSVYG